jgi:hypothetical protein
MQIISENATLPTGALELAVTACRIVLVDMTSCKQAVLEIEKHG